MSIYDTDWQSFRLPESDLPPDITFRVKERLNQNIEDATDDVVSNVLEEDIKAHRFLLAGVSPVFRAQFFGLMKEEEEVIEIKETTIEAFKDMIDWIYKVPTEMIIDREGGVAKMFEVFNIATKYQIWTLAMLVKGVITSVRLTKENVLVTAKVAEKFRQFDKLASRLSDRCSEFLHKELKTKEDICWFLASKIKQNSNKDNAIIFKLLSLNARCPNCKESECLDGQAVTSDSVIIGMKVVPVPMSAGAAFGEGTVGTVTKTLRPDQQIPQTSDHVFYIRWGTGIENALYIQSKGNPNFMIKCQ